MIAAKEAFRFFLRKTFDIRNGELLRASLMLLNIFFIISTLLIVKPTVNGLFLSKFGVEKLPYAFMLVAVVAAVVTTLYSKIVRSIPLNKIINGTLLFSVFSLLFFGLFLRLNLWEPLILFLFYIWVAIFALLATSQFWVLANIVFNAREAKRLFGFIGAGAIAGGIFGGYFTSVLAQFTSSENLPFWGAFFISLCIPINWIIWKRYVADKLSVFQQKKRTKGFGDHPFSLVRKSRHLTFLASIVGVSVIVAKLVDYQFGGVAAALIPDPDELTAFFGFWLSTFSVISLLLQLLVTRRVVGTFGVGASLLFLPGVIFLAVLALILFPGVLAAAVFLKMADGGLKQSINKAAMELLVLPVNQDIKNQTKTFIDVFVDSLATGISGILLIFLIDGLNFSTNAINAMIIGLLLLWIYLVSQVKKEYLLSFRRKIAFPENHQDKKEIDLNKESVLNGLKKVLESGSEHQQLVILKKIRGLANKRLFDSIKRLLNHPSDGIKVEAIRNLYFYKKDNITSDIEALVQTDNQNVKIAAFEYLVKHAKDSQEDFIEKYLHQADYRVRGAALISLASETRDNPDLARKFKLARLIQNKLDILPVITDQEELQFRTITALRAIGNASMSRFFPFLQSSFSSKNINIARQAIIEAGNTLSPKFIYPLVQLLSKPSFNTSVRTALVHYGNDIVPALEKMVQEGKIDLKLMREIPAVIKKIGTQQSVNFLFDLMHEDDLMVRQEALRGLNFVNNNFLHLKFSQREIDSILLREVQLYQETLIALFVEGQIDAASKNPVKTEKVEARKGLIHLLKKRLDRNLERIFRLLGLIHPNGDIYMIYKGIRSRKSDLRFSALEYMDNLLDPDLKKKLIPLLEASLQESISDEAIKNVPLKIPKEYECFQSLLNGKDTRIKLAVLYLLEQLKQAQFHDLIKQQMSSEDLKVRNFAERVALEI
ncbi:MAG: AAA family ATP:ADP antiporter [Saprospiraceae bacterium]|jgi:AAA family ATP:ADP antiporter